MWKNVEAASDLHVYLVESSPFMRQTQMKQLCNYAETEEVEPILLKNYASRFSNDIKIIWLQDLSELPKVEAPHFFLANEFFDALPVQKFQVKIFITKKKFYPLRRLISTSTFLYNGSQKKFGPILKIEYISYMLKIYANIYSI